MKTNLLSLIAILFLCVGWAWAAEETAIYHPKAIHPGQENTQKGYVVLILGSMSVGKTTISKQISENVGSFLMSLKSHPQVVQLAQDEEIDGRIDRTLRLEFPGWTNEHIILYQKIMEQACQNKVVICDLMLFESSDYDITESFISRLREKTNVFPALVICPMDQLVANTLRRNRSDEAFSRRSPDSVVDQYSEQLLSKSFDERKTMIVGSVTPGEIQKGIDLLSTSPAFESERKSRAICIRKLRELHSTSPSPIRVPTALYDFFIYNSSSSLNEGIKNICWALFTKISETFRSFQS